MNENIAVLEFFDRNEFRKWLYENHSYENSIWIKFIKGNKVFSANDALEESICFGWIDGVMKSIDDKSYIKYFSKRKDKHKWSEKNKLIYKDMINSKMMTKAGIEVYIPEDKKESTKNSIEDKIVELRKTLKATPEYLTIYDNKSPSRQKQFAGFYGDAKTEETKEKRKNKIIDALKNNYTGMLY
jgi:uncharacterized protein YdeI (YjbR/CyaY-like superfamily)